MIRSKINMVPNQNYLLTIDTDSLMYEAKSEDAFEDFNKDKLNFDFSNGLAKWKYCGNSNNLVLGKMKDETGAAVIK